MNPLAHALQTIFNSMDGLLSGGDSRGILTTLQECIAQADSLGNLAKENEALAAEIETVKERNKKELFVLKTNHEGELQRFHERSTSELRKLEALLNASKLEIERIKQEDAESDHLSTVERAILLYIDGAGQTLPDPLTKVIGRDIWTVERMLEELTKEKFLAAEYDPDGEPDDPAIYVLTKKGKAWIAKNKSTVADSGGTPLAAQQEIESLKVSIRAITIECIEAQNKVWELSQPSREIQLSAKETEILQCLKPQEIDKIRTAGVAFVCDISIELADALLKRLHKAGFATRISGEWYRSDEGGEYLVARDLLE